MFDVVLFQPEIPPNTGNVIRLCANTGARLHLIEPLGFSINDAQLRRAGLDYHEYAELRTWPNIDECLAVLGKRRVYALTTTGGTRYDSVSFQEGDVFIFGRETSGLPDDIMARIPPENRLRLPMRPDNRSVNLSNTVAVVVFEAWRQNGFAGMG